MIYRCKCGWEKRDHRNADTDVERVEWKPDDVKLEPTNAYGDIEFHGAGKTKRAKVLTNFYGTVITWNWLIIIYFSLGFATAFCFTFPPLSCFRAGNGFHKFWERIFCSLSLRMIRFYIFVSVEVFLYFRYY